MASLMNLSAIDIFISATFVCAFTKVLFRNRPLAKPRPVAVFTVFFFNNSGRNTQQQALRFSCQLSWAK